MYKEAVASQIGYSYRHIGKSTWIYASILGEIQNTNIKNNIIFIACRTIRQAYLSCQSFCEYVREQEPKLLLDFSVRSTIIRNSQCEVRFVSIELMGGLYGIGDVFNSIYFDTQDRVSGCYNRMEALYQCRDQKQRRKKWLK